MLHRIRHHGDSLPPGLRPIGEILPHTSIGRMLDIEWRLIAALLIDPSRRRELDLSADAFADPLAAAVITAMLYLETAGLSIDVRAISNRLDATGHDARAYRHRLARVLSDFIPAQRAADYWAEIKGGSTT